MDEYYQRNSMYSKTVCSLHFHSNSINLTEYTSYLRMGCAGLSTTYSQMNLVIDILNQRKEGLKLQIAEIDEAIKELKGKNPSKKSEANKPSNTGMLSILEAAVKRNPGKEARFFTDPADDNAEKKRIRAALYYGVRKGKFKKTRGKFYVK